jgi:hypothetical protein
MEAMMAFTIHAFKDTFPADAADWAARDSKKERDFFSIKVVMCTSLIK